MEEETGRSFITPAIFNDQPLQSGEPSYFQFQDYARTFARIIAHTGTRTPLTIGIHGEWGSGKTTLMRAMRDFLAASTGKDRPGFVGPDEEWKEAYRPVRTVWFNAWKYSREESLFVALVEEVLREMRRDGALYRLYQHLSDPKQPRLKMSEAVLNTVVQVFSLGKIDLDLTRFETESRFKTNLAFLDEFMQVLDDLLRCWVYTDYRPKDVRDEPIDDRRGVLAIFIDDLDRCLPEKTVQVLESIKLMMDRPGTVFVIGASRGMVEKAVAAHFRKGGFAELGAESERYLDKIIQIRFDLPPLQPEGAQSLSEFLDGLQAGERRLAEANPSLVKHLKLLTRSGETNPRRIKTFVNYAELQWAMLVNSGQAGEAIQDHFNLWLVLTEAGGREFGGWLEQLPREQRPQIIRQAIDYVKRGRVGEPGAEELPVDPNLVQYLERPRLRAVLGQLEEFDVTAEELHLYVHLCAPPVEEPEAGAAERVSPEVRGRRRARAALGEFLMDEFVRVPAGSFLMGSAADDPDAPDREKPQHPYVIKDEYLIGRYPVTNAEFARFVDDPEGYRGDGWWTAAGLEWRGTRAGPDMAGGEFDLPNHPAVMITWYEAAAYCRWLTAGLQDGGAIPANWEVRLPSEAQWEKAARGEYGRMWPWGNEWDPGHCNSGEGGPGRTTPVGHYSPQGDSEYGAADMAGNVWEWCGTKWVDSYEDYGEREDNELEGQAPRVVRGGSFMHARQYVRCACRGWDDPDSLYGNQGFRVVAAPVRGA